MPIRPEMRALYPPDWEDIRLEIRDVRAGGRCECAGECGTGHAARCGAWHGEPHPDTGSTVTLTVAHRDHNPANNDPANLAAMCQRCHLAYDAEEHARNASHTRAERAAAGMEPLFAACTAEALCSPCTKAEACDADGQRAAGAAFRLLCTDYEGRRVRERAAADALYNREAAALAVAAEFDSLTTTRLSERDDDHAF